MGQLCFLCSTTDCKVCSKCDVVHMCAAHQDVHVYEGRCLPWKLASVDGVERTMVATRDIQPMVT